MTPENNKKLKEKMVTAQKWSFAYVSETKLYDGDFEHIKSKKQTVLLKASQSNYDP